MDFTWSPLAATVVAVLGILVYALILSMRTEDDYDYPGSVAVSPVDPANDETIVNRPERQSVRVIPRISPSEAYSGVPDQGYRVTVRET